MERRCGICLVTLHSCRRTLPAFLADLEVWDGVTGPVCGLQAEKAGFIGPKEKTPDKCQRLLVSTQDCPWPDGLAHALTVLSNAVTLYARLSRGGVRRNAPA